MSNTTELVQADRVSVSLGVTKNLGDYNSLKVDAFYSTSVKPDESIEEAYSRSWAIADEQVSNTVDEYGN